MQIITQTNLVRIFKDNKDNGSDTRFVFLLGAGASVQSGIPSATTLAKQWNDEIKNDFGDDAYNKWIKDKAIDVKELASSYTNIFQKRFGHSPQNGYETLQKLMENKEPSIGYTILSQILEQTKHNFVITTNFDTLIEDALFLFTAKRPLVCGHESLADFIQLNSTRPTIIKVHRDILLDPYNTPSNTSTMEDKLTNALNPILENSPIVIIGYGGNDQSIMKLLQNQNRKPIYWCVRDTVAVSQNIKTLLKKSDMLVKIDGFDELMVALQAKVYEFESIKSLSHEDKMDSMIVKNAIKKVDGYKKQLKKFEQEVATSGSQEFKENSKSILPEWWKYELQAKAETDTNKKDAIYQEGIKKLPNSPELHGNYANFLNDITKDYDGAKHHYLKALEIEPNKANYNGNYAVFLNDIEKDYDGAKHHYLKALEIEPNHANNNSNYATFLKDITKDYDGAKHYHLKALEIEPNNAYANINYAGYLLGYNQKSEGEKFLNIAFNLLSDKYDLQLEFYFYKMVHFLESFQEAKDAIDILIDKGYDSLNWDFSRNILQAIKENHPHVETLKKYAKKISGIDYSNVETME